MARPPSTPRPAAIVIAAGLLVVLGPIEVLAGLILLGVLGDAGDVLIGLNGEGATRAGLGIVAIVVGPAGAIAALALWDRRRAGLYACLVLLGLTMAGSIVVAASGNDDQANLVALSIGLIAAAAFTGLFTAPARAAFGLEPLGPGGGPRTEPEPEDAPEPDEPEPDEPEPDEPEPGPDPSPGDRSPK